SYDGNSNVLTATDRRGVTSNYSYDNLNHVVLVRATGGTTSPINVLNVTPDNVGNPSSQTDQYGNTISFDYDSFHRLTKQTYPGGLTEPMSLDANGNVAQAKDRNGKVTTLQYDPLNRPRQMSDPLGRATQWDYDDAASKVTMTRVTQGLVVETISDALARP